MTETMQVSPEKEEVTVQIENDGITTSLVNEGNAENFVLSWKEVTYSVPMGKKTSKTLLHGMNGFVQSGTVTAIMGSSGAGKSTLLNTLAGRIGAGTLEGDILINGEPRNELSWRKLCSYVEQSDLMYTNLTVEETLMYSAMLRLPAKTSLADKKKRVDEIIMEFGLNNCRHTRVGGASRRGISGGELKRLSIGIELVTQPKILFLDEPTSGLDAFTAFNIIETIKKLAVTQNKLILMTIHQPRTDILELFDKLILLAAGKTVWYGTIPGALEHFTEMGFPLPPKTNPSDFFLDIISLDQRSAALRESSQARINAFHTSWNNKAAMLKISVPESKREATIVRDEEWPTTWPMQFWVLFGRNLKDMSRDAAVIGASFGQSIAVMILFGFIFYQVSLGQAGVQNRSGVIFMLCINLVFSTVMPLVNVFPMELEIIKRERAAGSYRATAAFVAKVVSTFPLLVVSNLVLTVPVYWIIGLQASATKFFTFIAVLLVHVFTSNGLGFLISSGVKNAQVGQIMAPLIVVVFLLFGGPLVSLSEVPEVFKWIQWVSLITYTNKALSQNEFEGLEFTCSSNSATCFQTGEQVLSQLNLATPSLWFNVLINFGLMCGFLIAGMFLFTRTSAPLMRLK